MVNTYFVLGGLKEALIEAVNKPMTVTSNNIDKIKTNKGYSAVDMTNQTDTTDNKWHLFKRR